MTAAPRDLLRAAITERNAAAEKVKVATEIANRAKGLLTAARSKLDSFGDIEARILAHRATGFKHAAQVCGPAPTAALPDDLRQKAKARDEAAYAVDAAKAAHDSLVGEFAEARHEAVKAERRVSELASAVLIAETTETGASLTDIWSGLWAAVDSLNALRGVLRVALPPEVTSTLQVFASMDHRQFPGATGNVQLAAAAEHWRKYHTALCESADASGEQKSKLDGGGSPSSSATKAA